VEFLKATDRRPLAETSIGVNTRTASALFERVDVGNGYKGVFTFPDAPEQCRGGLILPAEDNRHQVLLIGRGNDIPPINGDQFMSYAQELPTLTFYNAIKMQKRLTGITPFSFPKADGDISHKFLIFLMGYFRLEMQFVGLNPAYGQGMTVALQEANLLFDLLRTLDGSQLSTLAPTFLTKAETLIAAPWAMSAIPDFITRKPPGTPSRLGGSPQFPEGARSISCPRSGSI